MKTTREARVAVDMRGICKSFYGVQVLESVDFEVLAGEVHALVGGNGAGKSTLVKILRGVYSLDAGTVEVNGVPVHFTGSDDARRAGIGMVFQEFSLVPTLTVAQNIYLGVEPLRAGLIDSARMNRDAAALFHRMGIEIPVTAEIGSLSTAYWQLTEIAKALSQDVSVLVLDEPTASLAKHEAELLFELIRRLKSQGIAIIYITHRMEEIYQIADRITVLRNGRRLRTALRREITPEEIIEGIVGKQLGTAAGSGSHSTTELGEAVLEVERLCAGQRVRDVSFTLRAGEVVGVAGLMGSGRTELAETLFGVRKAESGQIRRGGRPVVVDSPRGAIANGLVLVPEDRRVQGLVLDHSVRANILLPLLDRISRRGFVNGSQGRKLADSLIKRFGVQVADPSRPVRQLSGGNQQKVVIAKWLGADPDVLVMDEPTAGVDVGTKAEIVELVRQLAREGHAVLVISSEYPELLAMCDRYLIMRDGTIAEDIPRSRITTEESLEQAVQGVK